MSSPAHANVRRAGRRVVSSDAAFSHWRHERAVRVRRDVIVHARREMSAGLRHCEPRVAESDSVKCHSAPAFLDARARECVLF